MNRNGLKTKLENLPAKPGIYVLKDNNSKIIYIGKAKNLRNRVRSYFQESRSENIKTDIMVSKVRDFDVILTDSEIEALILEANLVKEHKPRYNINLKDDKSFPFIRITNESFPQIFPTRNVVRDGSKYLGPYTDVKVMRQILNMVKRVFTVRSCKLKLNSASIEKGKYKVCLDYHIGKCQGPCEGLITEAEYNEMVNQVVCFLNGRHQELLRILTEKMADKVANLEFEQAARIRDQIKLIENFESKQKVVLEKDIDIDVFALAREDDYACGVVFKIREGKVIGRQHFYMMGVEKKEKKEILKNLLQQYYLTSEFVPEEILLPGLPAEFVSIKSWLQKEKEKKLKIYVPKIGEKAKIVELGKKNAKLLLEDLKLQKMKAKDYVPHSVKALQRDLRLEIPPRRIEAFDISNISGKDAVASLVCFLDGSPKKSEYKRFKIKTVHSSDDSAMMGEVIERRYSRVLKENKSFPDLILIDGGKGQLSAAVNVLKKLGIENQKIISLAKRLEEVYIPGVSEPQTIPKTSSGLKLLQRIRDEAHRFAVEFHRKVRKKRTITSELDKINGIGKNRRVTLLQYFGSVKRIKESTLKDLEKAPGVSKKLALEIWNYFNKK